MLKKTYAVLMSLLVVFLFCACGSYGSPADPDTDSDNSINVLCADFSEYDWVMNIIGDNPAGFNVQLLNETGADMHSFQPSVRDIAKIAECDLLVFTDGISEFWMDEALEVSSGEDMIELSLIESFMHSELKEVYYPDSEHDHDADEHDEDGHGHDGLHHHECDEHLWLSLRIAELCVGEIADTLCELDPENASYYKTNRDSYIDKLRRLDAAYEEALSSGSTKTLMFCDRFPFFYMMKDYGIEYFAAFPNCEAEAEASFETVVDLANALKEHELRSVVILENSSDQIASSVISAAGLKESGDEEISPDSQSPTAAVSSSDTEAGGDTVTGAENNDSSSEKTVHVRIMNSLQSISTEDMANGISYLSVMEKNLEAIKTALN